jgi:hypothetical protein
MATIGTLAALLLAGAAAAEPAPAARPPEDPDRIVCRQSEPRTGSRVSRQRLCRTVAQWRAYDADRAQMRRDLGAGNCNGDPSCSERSARILSPRPGPQ